MEFSTASEHVIVTYKEKNAGNEQARCILVSVFIMLWLQSPVCEWTQINERLSHNYETLLALKARPQDDPRRHFLAWNLFFIQQMRSILYVDKSKHAFWPCLTRLFPLSPY